MTEEDVAHRLGPAISRHTLTRRRRRARRIKAARLAGAMVALISALGSLFTVALTVISPGAGAGTTTASTFTKSAVDLNSGSQATTTTPGAASPGDTLKWILNYQNTTGSAA